MRFTIRQKLTVLIIFSLAVLAAGGAAMYWTVDSFRAAAESREPAIQTLALLKEMHSRLIDFETVERGFAVTGRAVYADQYAAASEKILRNMDSARALTAKNPDQLLKLDILRHLVRQRLDFTEGVLDVRKSKGRKGAEQLIQKGKGVKLGNEISSILSDMERTEEDRLLQWKGTMSIALYSVWIAAAALIIGTLVIFIISMASVLREYFRFLRIEQKAQQFSYALDHVTDLVTITNMSGNIQYVNKAVEETTGYAARDLKGKGRELWGAAPNVLEFFRKVRKNIRKGDLFRGEGVGKKRDGELFYMSEVVAPIKNRKGNITHIIYAARDITAQKNIEARLDYLAAYDPLTGLPNRRHFDERLQSEIIKAKKENIPLAILVIDIDQFKFINDFYGLDAGDALLKRTAEMISVCRPKGCAIARLGSDEFGIIAPYQEQADLVPLIQHIMLTLTKPVKENEDGVIATVSAGIALYPQDGEDAQSLMKNADIAIFKAKSQGRNSFQFYSPETSARISELVIMEKHLFSALKNQEYMMYYQPYCDLTTRKIVGSEALIRWNNDKFGLVSPAKFIPLLEDTNMIVDVGEWSLKTVCSQLKKWEKGFPIVPAAVNLSLVQFRQAQLVDMVKSAIKEFDLHPKYLTLEVTESIFMHDIDFASTVLDKLKGLGVSLSVDDFGTGYSSLSYLKKFPVDNVKLDISFIREVTEDPDVTSLVTAIIHMAHSLNLKTIAEGVETEEQMKLLRLLKCDIGQGYFVSPALTAQEFERQLV